MTYKSLQQPQSWLWRLFSFLKQRNRWLLMVGLVGIGLLLWLTSEQLIRLLGQASVVRVWIKGFGPLAPLVYVAFFATQILVAPLPGQFLGVIGGYLFGVVWGSLYGMAGLTLGVSLAITIARYFGRPLLQRFFDRAQLDYWERRLRMRSPVTWGLLFVFPVPDLVFYVAGLTSVPLRWLLPAVLIGRGTSLLFANFLGHWTALLPPEWAIVKWSILVVAGLVVYHYQRQIRFAALINLRRLRRSLRRLLSFFR
jgi:uncharacterized membrane protein YdjX (TVP38/TMEM64 family)